MLEMKWIVWSCLLIDYLFLPEDNEGPGPLVQSLPAVFSVLHNPHSVHADSETDQGRHDVKHVETALGEDIERYDDTDPLADVEEGVLDWVEDAEDHGEADDVVHGVTDGGDPEVLAQQVDVFSSKD